MAETLVIDRRKWLRGEGSDVSKLMRGSDGKMCCLGFYCRMLGFSEDEMLWCADPQDLRDRTMADDAKLGWLLWGRDIVNELIEANDHLHLYETEREAKIACLFAEQGVEVRFVN